MTPKTLEHGYVRGASLAAEPVSLPALFRMRLADYCILGKVRISLLVLVVTAVGFCLGSPGAVNLTLLLHTLIGSCLVAIAANTINQYMERDYDRLMIRTADRPIPAGRLTARQALVFGAFCVVAGTVYLLLFVNALSTGLAAATFALYLAAYTPLKRVTAWNTWVGAVPGALPPLIGFAGAGHGLHGAAWSLFAILFVWQLPHFFAIAWMYREDYERGGYRMLSTVDPGGNSTRRQTLWLSAALVLTSLAPWMIGQSAAWTLPGIVSIGAGLLVFAWRMHQDLSHATARAMLLASVIYLPLLMSMLLMGRTLQFAG